MDVGTWDGPESEDVESESRDLEVVEEIENGSLRETSRQQRRDERETRSEFDTPSSEVFGTRRVGRRVSSPLPTQLGVPGSPLPSTSLHPSTRSTGRHKPERHHRGTVDVSLTQLSPIGTGFQIGLSPVSPGFALVPTERRRRYGRTVSGDRERRRTVSEVWNGNT